MHRPGCSSLKLEGAAHPLLLSTGNFYKVAFSALNFTPSGSLNPCTALENMKAKIVYFESSDASGEGQIISVELSK